MVSANYSRWNLCLHFSSESRLSLFCRPRAHWTVGHQTPYKSSEVWNRGENLLGSDFLSSIVIENYVSLQRFKMEIRSTHMTLQAEAAEQEGALCHGLGGPLCLWTLTQIINTFFGEQSQLRTSFGNVNHSRSWGYWFTWTSGTSSISHLRGF